MSGFLDALRADLLDRRMRVVLIVLGVALIGALAYAFSGGSSSTRPAAPPPLTSSGAVGIAAVAAPANPNASVAEITSGASQQHGGATRNPFVPLPGSPSSAASTSSGAKSSSTASSATTASSGKSTSGSSESHPTSTTPQAAKPPAAKEHVVIHFHTSVEFGVLPAAPAPGVPPTATELRTYKDLKLNEALPSKKNAQLVYLGVVLRTGKSAVFELTGEVIIHGAGKCLPSPTQCRAIELHAGQSERLESVEANGTPVTYELKLVSISRTVTTGSAARAHAATGVLSKAWR
jgi:hypothetical protein